MYTESDIKHIVEKQREFFRSGKTLDLEFRIRQLKRLKKMITDHEKEIDDALKEDLGRAPLEAYFCDIGSVILEINETISGIRKWAKPETHFSGIHCFPSVITKVYKTPYGVSLIISPFNFPFILSLGVLTASIAGGNTAVIKASSKSAASTRLLKTMLSEIFPERYVSVIDGGHDVADMCLAQRFDKIFYTGSPRVGSHVLEAAAKNLTSTALELGGGCINEVCLHMMVKGVPFNGVGHSGMGAYHGKWGFMEFTHPTSVLIGSTKFNLPMREHPYSPSWKETLIKLFER